MDGSVLVVARISQLFLSFFKLFLFLNGGMLFLAVYNMYHSTENPRFMFCNLCMLTMNFWMMMLLFFMVVLCLKVCLIMNYTPEALQNNSWLQHIILFPFVENGGIMVGDEEMMQMAMQESMNADANTRSPPTLDKLLSTDLKWGFCMNPIQDPDLSLECLICSNKLEHTFPNIAGCVKLSCTCGTSFHRKCVLEWFHFNEIEATDTEPSRVTCPSCRHAFTL